jgi:spore coat protein U-like protein
MNPIRILRATASLARLLLLTGAGALAAAQAAHAVTCTTFSSPGWSLIYDPFSALAATTTSSVTVTCSRQAGDVKNLTLTVAAGSGLNAGTTNQALLAGSGALLQYGNYTDAANTLVWNTGGSTLSIPLAFGGVGSTATATIPFYAMIPAGQTALPPSGAATYIDTVSLQLLNGATAVSATTFPVNVTITPYCSITTAPGALSFAYTSLQGTPAAASSSFGVTCTSTVPYTASLDAYSVTDAAVNLAYTLNLGQTARPAGSAYVPSAPLSATGSGLAQTISIDGTIAAGQSGTCATATCTNAASANNIRTLTITY